MFLKIKRLTPFLIASTGAVALSKEIKETTFENKQNQNNAIEEEPDPNVYYNSTGWERVKTIFKLNEYNENSPDFVLMTSSVGVGALLGALIGAVRRNKKTLNDFMEKNDATKFQNITEARRELSRLLTKEMLRGAWEYAPSLAFIMGGFTITSSLVAAYRGKTGILEHVAAGALVGTLYRYNFGFRGMLVGLTTGSMFGALYGGTTYLYLKLSGDDLEQARKDFHNLYYYADRKLKRKLAEHEIEKMSSFEKAKTQHLRNLPLTLDHIDDTSKEIV